MEKNNQSPAKTFLTGIIIVLVYFISGKLGLSFASVNASATAVWPPTGIALAALLLFGYRYWPSIFIGAFLVNLTTSGGTATSIGIGIGNTLEALFGVWLVNRFASGKSAFDQPLTILRYVFLAGIIATALSASIGVLTLVWGGLAAPGQYQQIWLTWWLGDMGGALVIAPCLIIWGTKAIFRWRLGHYVEAAFFFLILIVVSQLVFGSYLNSAGYSVDFLIIPVLVWLAMRFGRRNTALAILILSAIATWGTLHGLGPFVGHSQNASLLLLETFMGIIGVTALTVAAVATESRHTQQILADYTDQLSREKSQTEAVLKSIGDGLVATDESGKIIVVNKAFEDLLGWSAKAVLRRKLADFLVMEDEDGKLVPETQRPLSMAIVTGKKVAADYILRRKNGTKFPVALTAAPILISGRVVGAIKIFRDITLEKQIDRAKSEFVSLASHQLHTPLTIVKWHSSRLLGAHQKLSAIKQQDYLRVIYNTNQRMIDLVNAILNVSKIDLGTLAVEPKPLSLAQVSAEAFDDLALPIKNKKLKIKQKYDAELPTIPLDPQLMQILFQNFLTNAIKYTPPGGTISCVISQSNKDLLITFSDTGCGIPPADHDKIFNKFYRTEAARKLDPEGNGLGMYIVRAIIQEANGNIWYKSKVNQGTTFYVTIPLSGMKRKEGIKGLVPIYS